MPGTPVPVAIALGSNVGDSAGHLAFAIDRLGWSLESFRASTIITTKPVGVSEQQPDYLNAAATGLTRLSARDLMRLLLELERGRGRERRSFRAARTLDLDLILYGDLVVDEPGLTVPHPRFRERRFVLEPLVEIAPDWRDPVTGLTMKDLLRGTEADAIG